MGDAHHIRPGVLKILVQGASSLDNLVTVGEQQPYYILECGAQRSRSKPCLSSGRNPVWNTAHKYNLSDELSATIVVKDEVTRGVIGQAELDLSRARFIGKDEESVPLTTMGGQQRGSLDLKLKFSPIDGYLPGEAALAAHQSAAAAAALLEGDGSSSPGSYGPDSPRSHGVGTVPTPVSSVHRSPDSAGVGMGSFQAPSTADVVSRPLSVTTSDRRRATSTSDVSYMDEDLDGSYEEAGAAGGGDVGVTADAEADAAAQHARLEEDRALRSASSKVSLARAAMQQLTAELAELTGGPGLSSPTAAAAHAATANGGSGAGSLASPASSTGRSLQLQHEEPQQVSASHGFLRSSKRSFDSGASSPAKAAAAAAATGAGTASGGSISQHWPPAAAQREPWEKTAPLPPVRTKPADKAATAGAAAAMAAAGAAAASPAAANSSQAVLVDDLLALYSQTSGQLKDYRAAHDEQATVLQQQKGAIAALQEALQVAHAEKVSVEEELESIKQSMAAMTREHYMEIKKARGQQPQQQVKATAAVNGAVPRSSEDGMDVHRLEILVHQQSRQLAEQQQKLDAQAVEIATLRSQLDTNLASTSDHSTALESAQATAATATAAAAAARAEAAAATAAARKSDAAATAANGMVEGLRAELAAAVAAKARAEVSVREAAAAAATETGAKLESSRREVEALRAALAKAEAAVAAAAARDDEVAELARQLAVAEEELGRLRGAGEEVEYLQQQLRKGMRQVVELQHQVQTLKASSSGARTPAPAAAASAAPPNLPPGVDVPKLIDENEFLMGQLVATKMELAELKEREIVAQRQLSRSRASQSQ